MADEIVRATTIDGYFRAIAIDATEMMKEAAQFHAASPLGVEILGRALVGSLLVSNAVLKGDEHLAVNIDGNGPAGKIAVEASAEGLVRGYVSNPQVELPLTADGQYDVAGAVGTDGFLRITKEIDFGEPFTGSVQLVTGQIGDDLTYYMAKSEQIPSAVAVSVKVNEDSSVVAAVGFIISALPDATDDAISNLESTLHNFPNIAAQLLEGYTPFNLIEQIFGAENVKLLATTDVALFPEISKGEYAKMLATLPVAELQNMLREDHGVEIVDRFTGRKLQFSEAELATIIESVQK